MELSGDDLTGEIGKGNRGYESSEPMDLYEDIVGGSLQSRPGYLMSDGSPGTPNSKYQLYVGNLTWWTTDRDIADAIRAVGIRDFLEVKFFENKPNGQSKGYCTVSFGSEQSVKMCMEGLPRAILHGNNPVVVYPSKQAIINFEANCKTRQSPVNPGPQQQLRPMNHAFMARGVRPRMVPPGVQQGGIPTSVNGPPRHLPPPSHWHNGPPQPLPSGPPPQIHRPPIPNTDQRVPLMRPDWNRPPVVRPGFPPQGMNMSQPPPATPRALPPPSVPSQGHNPLVNQQFFHPGGPPPRPNPALGAPPPGYFPAGQAKFHNYPPPPIQDRKPNVPKLPDPEFEEIMARNRTVSSSAIARAVSDAAAGEFGSAIETLVTAISLIKQSKAAHDDRCKILVSSLQDTLHGVEGKSYAPRRERSHSRDRERSHRRSRRDRSRSRERDYRDRSRDREREKDRYYESYSSRDRSRSRDRTDKEYRERSDKEYRERSDKEYRDRGREEKYYEERYRERERERERGEQSRRDPERERERESKEEVAATSTHKTSRH